MRSFWNLIQFYQNRIPILNWNKKYNISRIFFFISSLFTFVKKKLLKFATQKWPFYELFWPDFYQLDLKNWGADGHFRVIRVPNNNWIKSSDIIFFHGWKCRISWLASWSSYFSNILWANFHDPHIQGKWKLKITIVCRTFH